MKHLYLLTILLSTFLSFSQQKATTADGKTVILNADGTWTSVPQIDNTSIPKHAELPKAKPQDVIINHLAYTLSYNTTYNIANWVAYELTAEETVATVKRDDHFAADPLLHSNTVSNTDYKGSGYDKGHLAPSADMCYSSQSMIESFYLTNMSPQDPSFNRGIWSRMEKQVRQWAVDDTKIYVVTGTILSKGLPTIGYNKISVPLFFYKVILDYTEPEINGYCHLHQSQLSGVEKQDNTVQSSSPKRSSTVRCSATTKKGTQCSRMTFSANGKCWQHGGD